MAGNIDATFSSRLSTAQHVKSGKMRLLAVVGNRRSALYPDIPTFADVGLGDVIVPYAMGAYVSAKTPPDVVATLNRDYVKVLHEPAVEERFASEGVVVGNLTPEALKARMRREVGIIEQVIIKNNVKLE
jgi:tripartite-type tricarboxylate transporter receptor subunit TctC